MEAKRPSVFKLIFIGECIAWRRSKIRSRLDPGQIQRCTLQTERERQRERGRERQRQRDRQRERMEREREREGEGKNEKKKRGRAFEERPNATLSLDLTDAGRSFNVTQEE